MTAVEAYEMTSQGGATDFAEVIQLCRGLGPYCLIGGLAVNCYVEPVYTMDAELVLVAAHLPALPPRLAEAGFAVDRFPHAVNAKRGDSQLRIPFTTDARYQDFPGRASLRTVLGELVMVASGRCFPGEAVGLVRPGAANDQAQERRVGFAAPCRIRARIARQPPRRSA